MRTFSRERTKTRQTLVRTVSALGAVFLLIVSYWFGKEKGLAAFAYAVVLIGQIEFVQMLLQDRLPVFTRVMFVVLCSTSLLFGLYSASQYTTALAFAFIPLFVGNMFAAKSSKSLGMVLDTAGIISLGVIYCSVLPFFVIRLLMLPKGLVLFVTLLGIVFAGDTLAYFVGRKFGKKKLWEIISPKKTWAGAMGGLAGSTVVGIASGFLFFREESVALLALVACCSGATAQFGDLFESMVKRAAGVKDSGHIMPGHGGMMDRIDGVVFAAPVFYLWAANFPIFGP